MLSIQSTDEANTFHHEVLTKEPTQLAEKYQSRQPIDLGPFVGYLEFALDVFTINGKIRKGLRRGLGYIIAKAAWYWNGTAEEGWRKKKR